MPTEPPLRLTIAVLMPTTWPRPLISGPPLLPGLIEASVWMKSSYGPSPITRPVALTMPVVTVCSRPNGLPIAMTGSPTFSAADAPGEFAPVRELHADLRGTVHHVVVRHDVAVGVDHEAGAEAALRARWDAAEELLEERVDRLGGRLRPALHADVDDGGLERLRQGDPVGRGDRGGRHRHRLVAPELRRGRAAVFEGRAQRDQDEDEAGDHRQPATESRIELHRIRLLFGKSG